MLCFQHIIKQRILQDIIYPKVLIDKRRFRYIFYDGIISEKRSVDKWLWFFTIVTTPNITIGAVEYILLLYSRSYPYQLLETTSHTSILMQVVNPNAKLLESTTSSLIAYYNIFPVKLELLSTCSTLLYV